MNKKVYLLILLYLFSSSGHSEEGNFCVEPGVSKSSAFSKAFDYAKNNNSLEKFDGNIDGWFIKRKRCHIVLENKKRDASTFYSRFVISPQGVVVNVLPYSISEGCPILEKKQADFSVDELAVLADEARLKFKNLPGRLQGAELSAVPSRDCFLYYMEMKKTKSRPVIAMFKFDYLGNLYDFFEQ